MVCLLSIGNPPGFPGMKTEWLFKRRKVHPPSKTAFLFQLHIKFSPPSHSSYEFFSNVKPNELRASKGCLTYAERLSSKSFGVSAHLHPVRMNTKSLLPP